MRKPWRRDDDPGKKVRVFSILKISVWFQKICFIWNLSLFLFRTHLKAKSSIPARKRLFIRKATGGVNHFFTQTIWITKNYWHFLTDLFWCLKRLKSCPCNGIYQSRFVLRMSHTRRMVNTHFLYKKVVYKKDCPKPPKK